MCRMVSYVVSLDIGREEEIALETSFSGITSQISLHETQIWTWLEKFNANSTSQEVLGSH